MKLLLDRGADVNIVSESSGSYELGDGSLEYWKETETSLYVACEMGRDKVVKLLLERGADVNMGKKTTESDELPVGEGSTTTSTETPLDVAECKQFKKIVTLLTAKTTKEKQADATASVKAATEKYKKKLKSIAAVRYLSDKDATEALSAMRVKGRGARLLKKGRHDLLIKHLGLTE